MSEATELLRRALEALEEMNASLESEFGTPFSTWRPPLIIKDIRTYLSTLFDDAEEPVAWMFPDDIERFQTDETFAQAFSVKCGSPTQGITLPLFLYPPKPIEAIDRNKTVEECARACENAMSRNPVSGAVIDRCAAAIRELKDGN